ncbi:MAG: adenosylcobinamide-GDP ribazoletransferase [Aestuariivita sp.]|nr:adenosylcobinamide-GDP ribazoletransferase [Aestuariivita sp.]
MNDFFSIQLKDIIIALTLLSRLSIPHNIITSFDRQALATWAFPIIGVIVSSITIIVATLAMTLGLLPGLTAGLVLATQIIITGALHEDGLADTADGFWGGHSVKQRLEIMSDSTLGTYGILVLIITIGLRWLSLTIILQYSIWSIMAIAVISRAVLPALMAWLPAAKATGLSATIGAPPSMSAILALLLGSAISAVILGITLIPILLTLTLTVICIALIAQNKINGQTGDVLGATQQMSETICLILLASML